MRCKKYNGKFVFRPTIAPVVSIIKPEYDKETAKPKTSQTAIPETMTNNTDGYNVATGAGFNNRSKLANKLKTVAIHNTDSKLKKFISLKL